MIAGGWWLEGVLSVAALFGCGPSAGRGPPPTVASDASQPAERRDDREAREEWSTLKGKEDDACVPPAMLDGKLRPVDTKSEASVRAALGHLVLVCARVRLASGGRVVDAATPAPIAGATVTVESWRAMPPLALRATTVAKDPRPDPARSKCGLPLGPGL